MAFLPVQAGFMVAVSLFQSEMSGIVVKVDSSSSDSDLLHSSVHKSRGNQEKCQGGQPVA
jgi:hypothetical protein